MNEYRVMNTITGEVAAQFCERDEPMARKLADVLRRNDRAFKVPGSEGWVVLTIPDTPPLVPDADG